LNLLPSAMHFRGWLGAHGLLPTISGTPLMLPGAIGGAVRASDNTVHVGAARVLDDAGGLPPAWDAPPSLRLTGGGLLASDSLRGSAFTHRLGNLASSSASAFVSVSAVMLRNVAQNGLAWPMLISCGVSSAVQLLSSLVAALQPKLCARQWLSMVLPAVVMQTNAGDTAHTAQATKCGSRTGHTQRISSTDHWQHTLGSCAGSWGGFVRAHITLALVLYIRVFPTS
jgi:hypothetical protein